MWNADVQAIGKFDLANLIPVAQWVSQIPTDTHQNNGFFDAVAFEVDYVRSLLSIGRKNSLPEPGAFQLTQQNCLMNYPVTFLSKFDISCETSSV